MIFKKRILSQRPKKFRADIDNSWFLLKLELVLCKLRASKEQKKNQITPSFICSQDAHFVLTYFGPIKPTHKFKVK